MPTGSALRRGPFVLVGSVVLAAVIALSTLMAGSASADGKYGGRWVFGRIEQAYLATGGPNMWGNPTNNESAAANGGRFQNFAKDTAFYWHPRVANGVAHQVGGAIRAKWAGLNWERGPLGYPTSNEQATANDGRMNSFQGGNVYWGPYSDAHPVWGEIYKVWQRSGGANSWYQLPTSDEYRIGTSFAQDFQGGTITWP
ncbi:hypothetical protein GCM10027169_36200 [Gordonia jinhuaensis]|uniref:LGFP repeat-containing protein n=1 Tax=Gordonia jinhuaensis TaxID=1517702 RepID=A0A916T4Z0_9ACTN|nr:lysozyme [Gordonia jinhuaensis]GGB29432.1 hypothetical protein GCM10011489_16940 [Gordonia jinhuaensis]